jgi:phosphopantothenoylcysteine decarboxylase/phosphopantothenate--cysteine ligase
MLKGKKILLGVTGSIAAYKAIYLLRLLVKAGAEIKVIITPAAKEFVSTLTLSTLSKQEVLSDLYNESSWANHVALGRWADLMIIAPLSCNTLAKMANGICDNLLLAVYLSATCPIMLAPAMDEDMWNHFSTKRNIKTVEGYGNSVIPVGKGELASGLTGEGRMAEPEELFKTVEAFFLRGRLTGKNALVTAGPTYEPIDPVRFIGNRSTGKMGVAIVKALVSEGASVKMIAGPGVDLTSLHGVEVCQVNTAAEMLEFSTRYFETSDIAVMAAAVADYKPAEAGQEKIKKTDAELSLHLIRTADILKTLGKKKTKDQLLIGFALETNNEKENALKKLKEKNADMIVLNSLRDPGAGFGYDTNKITIFDKGGEEFTFETKEKSAVAKDIVDTIIRLYYA